MTGNERRGDGECFATKDPDRYVLGGYLINPIFGDPLTFSQAKPALLIMFPVNYLIIYKICLQNL